MRLSNGVQFTGRLTVDSMVEAGAVDGERYPPLKKPPSIPPLRPVGVYSSNQNLTVVIWIHKQGSRSERAQLFKARSLLTVAKDR